MKQAVILIHGIGEQRPLETLRSFDALSVGQDIRNKPDTVNLSLELRRLQVGKSRNRPITDFFEFYWAHHMRDTKLRMIMQWFRAMLVKWPWKVPAKLFPFFCMGWLLTFFTSYYFYSLYSTFDKFKLVLIVLVFGIDYLFLRFCIGYIGDAARYLNPDPDNIAQRNNIRTECLELLLRLHNSGQYSRIILVGHSLGTVIAYDTLRLYWSLYLTPESMNCDNQEVIERFSYRKNEIFNNSAATHSAKIQKFQELQNELWFELRRNRLPWLISDFISLGSPLAHAAMLLARNESEFQRKKDEGEYPQCPPSTAKHEEVFIAKNIVKNDGTRACVKFPRFNAPFCCTRWTNIYFPHKFVIFGDFIGGPVQKAFGHGIRDVPVSFGSAFSQLLNSHVRYWEKLGDWKEENHPLKMLKSYLALDCLRGNRKRQGDWPPPPSAG